MSQDLLDRFAIDRWPLVSIRLTLASWEHGFANQAKGPDAFANTLQTIGPWYLIVENRIE
jgi:hypothetical protein